MSKWYEERLVRSPGADPVKNETAESRLDYFGARYYASSMGRFMSPDPIKLTG